MKKILFSLIMFLLGTVQMLAATEANLPTTAGSTLSNGYIYKVTTNTTIRNNSAGGNGLNVASGATVTIYIAKGVTLYCYGGNGSYQTAGGAGISVPSNSTLIITGEGTLVCYGGNAGAGSKGGNAYSASLSISGNNGIGGNGGNGGAGGGGAGAGIGGRGGDGAATNPGGKGVKKYCNGDAFDGTGGDGNDTQPGYNGSSMGYVYAVGTVTIKAYPGSASTTAGAAGDWGTASHATDAGSGWNNNYTAAIGGGGGGGGAGYGASYGIGGGAAGAQSGASAGAGGTMKNSKGRSYLTGGDAYVGGTGNRNGSARGYDPNHDYGKHGGYGGRQSERYASAGGNGYFYAMTTVNKSYANRSATTITTPPAAIKSTVTFSIPAESGENYTNTYYYGIKMNAVSVPVVPGKYFKGFYTAATGGTRKFNEKGEPITTNSLSDFATATTTLYAQWEDKFVPTTDGGMGLKQNTNVTNDDVNTFLGNIEDDDVRTKLDLSTATSIEDPDNLVMSVRGDKHFNKNTFIYVPTGTTFVNDELTENILFKNTQGQISCPNLHVYDGIDMVIPQTFTADNARYDRLNTHRWGTICVPFALESTANVQFYTSGVLKEIGGQQVLVLEKAAFIEAGKPAIYQITDLEGDTTDDIYLGASNAAIVTGATPTETDIVLHGDFVGKEIEDEGVYYYSNNTFYLKTAALPLKVPAFRAYIALNEGEAANAPRRLLVADADNPTAIYGIALDDNDALEMISTYDLSGRRIEGAHQGVIIKGGKKMIK